MRDFIVKHGRRRKRQRDTIPGPMAQLDYFTNFNAVDRNDRDIADYSTTIRTARYFLRISAEPLIVPFTLATVSSSIWRQATLGRQIGDVIVAQNLDATIFKLILACR